MRVKKKILIIAPFGFNDRLANFMEFISARMLQINGWQVTALTRRVTGAVEPNSYQGIIIKRYQNFKRGILPLLNALLFNRPNLVHIYHLRNNRLGALAGVLAKLLAIPLVFTEYGLLHDHYLVADRDDPLDKPLKPQGLVFSLRQLAAKTLRTPGIPLFYNLKNYLYHWSLTHADQTVFVSKHNFAIAAELGLKNCLYLPYFFDDDRWKINQGLGQDNGKELDIIKKINSLPQPIILFVGQIKLRKGWDIYLEAIKLIDKNIAPAFALVSHSGAQPSEDLTGMIKELRIEDRIFYFGQISEQSLKKIYQMSTIVVVPSRYEGFGLVAIEAMAMDKPIIASAVPALTETVVDGYNGLLVQAKNPEKLAQAITKLINDQELRLRLVAGGRETLRKLKSEQLKNQWLEFYDKIIS